MGILRVFYGYYLIGEGGMREAGLRQKKVKYGRFNRLLVQRILRGE
jgi:hypothetical protein